MSQTASRGRAPAVGQELLRTGRLGSEVELTLPGLEQAPVVHLPVVDVDIIDSGARDPQGAQRVAIGRRQPIVLRQRDGQLGCGGGRRCGGLIQGADRNGVEAVDHQPDGTGHRENPALFPVPGLGRQWRIVEADRGDMPRDFGAADLLQAQRGGKTRRRVRHGIGEGASDARSGSDRLESIPEPGILGIQAEAVQRPPQVALLCADGRREVGGRRQIALRGGIDV